VTVAPFSKFCILKVKDSNEHCVKGEMRRDIMIREDKVEEEIS
jgi:hypothetical protein